MTTSPPPAFTPQPVRRVWTVGTLTYTTGGLAALFGLLLWGDFAMSMKERAVTPVFQVVLHKFGASDSLFALLCSSVPAALAMILIPIVAYRSDRHRGPWGRRIPYIFIPVPFAALSMAGLGFSPMIGTQLHILLGPSAPDLNTCILLTFGFFWVIYDFANIIGSAVFFGLINDVVPREVIGRFFGAFRAVSLIAGILFNYYLMNQAATAYLQIFVGTALLFGLGFGLICLRLKEGEYPPPPAGSNQGIRGFLDAARSFFVECFSIPFYLWYFAAFVCATLAFVPANLYNIPFAASLNVNYGECLALVFTISLLLAYPLGVLADRFHPLPLCFIALFFYMLATLWGGLFALNATTSYLALILHGVLSGTFGTLAASLGNRLLPKASFAQFTAAGGMLVGICSVIIPPLIGWHLDRSGGHVYRHTYLMSFGFAALGCVFFAILYFQFLKHGGVRNYVAPDRGV